MAASTRPQEETELRQRLLHPTRPDSASPSEEDMDADKKTRRRRASSLSLASLEEPIKEISAKSEYRIDILLAILLTILAFATRFYKIDTPSKVVFDEVHFGKFASYYIRRTFFFDVHPPLAKMLLAFVGWFVGFDGSFLFKEIGLDYIEHGVPYVAFRAWSAFCGAAVVPVIYLTMRESGYTLMASSLAAFLILLDNGLVTQSRLILLDSMLMVFMCITIYCYVRFYKLRRQEYSMEWWGWLCACGTFLALTLSVKMVGLFTMALIGVAVLIDLWEKLDIRRGLTLPDFARHFLARAFGLILLPFLVYLLCFYIHFAILSRSGPGDSFMSLQFQSTLEGNKMISESLEIRYGDNITFQHQDTKVYLHSHPHNYPLRYEDKRVSTTGQQITGYAHADENNFWRIWPVDPAVAELTEPTPEDEAVVSDSITPTVEPSQDAEALFADAKDTPADSSDPSAETSTPLSEEHVELRRRSLNEDGEKKANSKAAGSKDKKKFEDPPVRKAKGAKAAQKATGSVVAPPASTAASASSPQDAAHRAKYPEWDQVIRHGDLVRIEHIPTNGFLLTHDVASPLTTTNTEVTLFPGNRTHKFKIPRNMLWRIEIEGGVKGKTAWKSHSQSVRIVHSQLNVALHTYRSKLPEWGFSQQEINGNKKVAEGSANLWIAREIQGRKVTEEEKASRKLGSMSFFAKFWELQQAMIRHNNKLTSSHPYQSEPLSWPILLRGISFWTGKEDKRQIYLLGNPFGWWIGGVAILSWSVLMLTVAIGAQRGQELMTSRVHKRMWRSGGFIILAWLLHYGPFFLMGRQLFLHHYLPSVILSYAAVGVLFDFALVHGVNWPVVQANPGAPPLARSRPTYLAVILWTTILLLQAWVYYHFSPFVYGHRTLEKEEVLSRQWLSTWDFHYAKAK